jgi:magnesium transporter
MLVAYIIRKTIESHIITQDNRELLKEALWIDLLSPSKEEEDLVEHYLGLGIPTREEMIEIEQSSRLYKENGILFLTAIMIAQHESADPILDPVTFILTPKQLITMRYIEPKSFNIFSNKLQKTAPSSYDALTLLLDLYDVTIDRLADTLELVGHRLDEYSKNIFRSHNQNEANVDYRNLMQQIGANGDLNTKARESLVTFNRLIVFLGHTEDSRIDSDKQSRLATLGKDIDSLSDHANFLSTKVNFLLDATLGMVNIEQNNIIKIFSVAAVIFLPPTLVASIYGMNFHFMPELHWKYGYIFAVALILVAAWLPYKYFKYKKWL